MIFDFVPLTYGANYVYPGWAQGIGVCMGLVSMICVPGAFIYDLLRAKGTFREVGAFIYIKRIRNHAYAFRS